MDTTLRFKRADGIVAEKVDGEFLVCNPKFNETSLLNGEVAQLFEALSESEFTTAESLKPSFPNLDIEAALTVLLEKNLIVMQDEEHLVSRRELLVSTGRLAAAATLITTLGMPKPAAAQSPVNCAALTATSTVTFIADTTTPAPAGALCYAARTLLSGGGGGGGGGGGVNASFPGGDGGDGGAPQLISTARFPLQAASIVVVVGAGGQGGGAGLRAGGGGAGGGGLSDGADGTSGGAGGGAGVSAGGGGGGEGGGASSIASLGFAVDAIAEGGGGGGGGEGGDTTVAGAPGTAGGTPDPQSAGIGGDGASTGGVGGDGGLGENGSPGTDQGVAGGGSGGALNGTAGANGADGLVVVQFFQ